MEDICLAVVGWWVCGRGWGLVCSDKPEDYSDWSLSSLQGLPKSDRSKAWGLMKGNPVHSFLPFSLPITVHLETFAAV